MFKKIVKKQAVVLLLSIVLTFPLLILTQTKEISGTYKREDASEVPNSTIIIGRHMIFLASLSTELIEKARSSASEQDPNLPKDAQENQNSIYYKSEVVLEKDLNSSNDNTDVNTGTWFQIDDLESINDISTAGKPISNNVINNLYLLYYTKDDGLTYDLNTGKLVDIFRLNNIYDLYALPELRNLKEKYESYLSSNNVKKLRSKEISSLERILKASIDKNSAAQQERVETIPTSETTEEEKNKLNTSEKVIDKTPTIKKDTLAYFDENLDNLNEYFQHLVKNDASFYEIEALRKIQANQDAMRKCLFYDKVNELLQNEIEYASSPTDDEKITSYPELCSAYEIAANNVKEAKDSYEPKIISQGNTIIPQAAYEKNNKVLCEVLNESYSNASLYLKGLTYIDNIANKNVIDKANEIKTAKEMLKTVTTNYDKAISGGATAEYKDCKSKNEISIVQNGLKRSYLSGIDMYKSDIQILIAACLLRLDLKEKVEYINTEIKTFENIKARIILDDFQDDLTTNIDTLLKFLTDEIVKYQTLINGGTEQDKLNADIKILQTEYQKALDNNNLADAEQLKAKMQNIANQSDNDNKNVLKEYLDIEETIKKLEDTNNQSQVEQISELKKQSKILQNQLGTANASTINDISALANEAITTIKNAKVNTDINKLNEIVNGIINSPTCEFGSALNNAALKKISNSLSERINNNDSYPNKLNDVYDKVNGVLESGLETIAAEMKTEAEIKAQIDNISNMWLDVTDEEKKAIELLSINELANITGSSIYKNLLNFELNEANKSSNNLIIDKVERTNDGKVQLCIPLSKLGSLIGYEYVWYENYEKAYIAGDAQIYRFENKSNIVKCTKLTSTDIETDYEKEIMPGYAEFLNDMTIPSDYVLKTFKIGSRELESTAYAILYNPKMDVKFRELTEKLKSN